MKEHLLCEEEEEEEEVELFFMKGVVALVAVVPAVEDRLLDEPSFFDNFHFSSK